MQLDEKTARQTFSGKIAGLLGRLLAYLIVFILRLLPQRLRAYFISKLQYLMLKARMRQQNPPLYFLLEYQKAVAHEKRSDQTSEILGGLFLILFLLFFIASLMLGDEHWLSSWLGMALVFMFFWSIAFAALSSLHQSWKRYLTLQPFADRLPGLGGLLLLLANRGEEPLTTERLSTRDVVWITLVIGGIGIVAFLLPLIVLFDLGPMVYKLLSNLWPAAIVTLAFAVFAGIFFALFTVVLPTNWADRIGVIPIALISLLLASLIYLSAFPPFQNAFLFAVIAVLSVVPILVVVRIFQENIKPRVSRLILKLRR